MFRSLFLTILVISCALVDISSGVPLVHSKNVEKSLRPLTQGGEDPDPIIRDRRNAVKKVEKNLKNLKTITIKFSYR